MNNNIFIYSIRAATGLFRENLSQKQAKQLAYTLEMNAVPYTMFKENKETKEITTVSMEFLDLTSKKKKDTKELGYDLTDDGKGKKYDNGKPMIGTLVRVFPLALEALGSVIEFGTHKYPQPDNWKKVEGAKYRYLDSLMRHMVKHYKGMELDEETNKPHLAHMAWNALAILELYLMEKNEKQQK